MAVAFAVPLRLDWLELVLPEPSAVGPGVRLFDLVQRHIGSVTGHNCAAWFLADQEHFFGPVVVAEKPGYHPRFKVFDIIDGQQRFTTVATYYSVFWTSEPADVRPAERSVSLSSKRQHLRQVRTLDGAQFR